MLNGSVLVLNQNYQPLNVCSTGRAIRLLLVGKAELLEEGDQPVRSSSALFPRPSVIRLIYLIRRPQPTIKLSRREVFLRDNNTCQYCGKYTRDLTLDHVVPRHRGGKHEWGNLVSACRICNHRKGGRTLEEAHMTLQRFPSQPRASIYYLFQPYLESFTEWRKFLPYWGRDSAAAFSYAQPTES